MIPIGTIIKISPTEHWVKVKDGLSASWIIVNPLKQKAALKEGQILTNPMTESDLVIEAMQQEKTKAGEFVVVRREDLEAINMEFWNYCTNPIAKAAWKRLKSTLKASE